MDFSVSFKITCTVSLALALHFILQKLEVCAQLLTPQNASKFAIFMEKENPCSFFCLFFFRATLSLHRPGGIDKLKLTQDLRFCTDYLTIFHDIRIQKIF